jgi:hypothetical protein
MPVNVMRLTVIDVTSVVLKDGMVLMSNISSGCVHAYNIIIGCMMNANTNATIHVYDSIGRHSLRA